MEPYTYQHFDATLRAGGRGLVVVFRGPGVEQPVRRIPLPSDEDIGRAECKNQIQGTQFQMKAK